MTAEEPKAARKPVLDPVERLSEILFGLIMALTFTGSLSVASAGRADVREMLIGAIGCNIAWGLIDAIMYLMACLNQCGLNAQTIRSLKRSKSREHAHSVILDNVPRLIAEELPPDVLDRIRARILDMPQAAGRPRLRRKDFHGALGVFLIVVASTLPVIMPFLFMQDLQDAMRLSNAIAVGMLAFIGYAYGRASGISPVWTAATMVLLGSILVALTIALGG